MVEGKVISISQKGKSVEPTSIRFSIKLIPIGPYQSYSGSGNFRCVANATKKEVKQEVRYAGETIISIHQFDTSDVKDGITCYFAGSVQSSTSHIPHFDVVKDFIQIAEGETYDIPFNAN